MQEKQKHFWEVCVSRACHLQVEIFTSPFLKKQLRSSKNGCVDGVYVIVFSYCCRFSMRVLYGLFVILSAEYFWFHSHVGLSSWGLNLLHIQIISQPPERQPFSVHTEIKDPIIMMDAPP